MGAWQALKSCATGIAEWYSPVKPGSGLHPRPASANVLQGYFSEIDPSWSSIWYSSRKGEDVEQCHDRTERFLSALIPEVERRFNGKHKCILLVSHAATIIALNRAFVGDRCIPMRIGCCSISEFKRKTVGAKPLDGWEMTRMGDGSHLKEGSTRDWGFEDITIADGKVRIWLLSSASCFLMGISRSWTTSASREPKANRRDLLAFNFP